MYLFNLQTTLSSKDSVENLIEKLKSNGNGEDLTNKPLPVTHTSTTPLEPDKNLSWKSVDNVSDTDTVNNNKVVKIDDEFDVFTKERLEKKTNSATPLKKPTQAPLEPTILVLNVGKKNLTTLAEEDDLNNMISNAASSITEFCQNNFLKDLSPMKSDDNTDPIKEEYKENNPFLIDLQKRMQIEDENKESDVTKVQIEKTVFEPTNIPIEVMKEVPIAQRKEKIFREDSPAPSMNFEEIGRKPKMLIRSKTGLDTEECRKTTMPENKPFLRDRSASIGTLNLKTPITQLIGEQNRTMLFQVSK